MPKIFRVQDENGMGCYTSHIPCDFIDNHSHHNGHPRAEYDKGIERDVEYGVEICGFIDEEQARNWFTDSELLTMADYGFYLVEIEVSCITAIGEKQVLAIPLTNKVRRYDYVEYAR